MKLHPGPEWRIFHILTSEVIDDVISRFFTVVCANSQFVYIIKRKLHGGLKIWILFSFVKNNILPLESKIHITQNMGPYCAVESNFVLVIRTRVMRSARFFDDGGCISKTRSRNTRKWHNNGIINPLLDGLTYNKLIARKISARIIHMYVKPSNKVYISIEMAWEKALQ